MGAISPTCLLLLCLISAVGAQAAKAAHCSSGRTHANLLQAEELPAACLPSADDYTGQAVFQCLQSWKITYSGCKVVLAPDLPYSSSGLPCRFFSSQGNITGDHTARVQAVVDRAGLLAFLLSNPQIAGRLNGGDASAPASSRELAENLALALHSFFHHDKHHKHPKRPKLAPQTPAATSATPAAAAATPSLYARRLLLDPQMAQLPPGAASSAPKGIMAGSAGATAGSGATATEGELLSGRGAAADMDDMSDDDEPAEVSRSANHLYFASIDSCVYVYKVKRHSKFLNPEAAPGHRTGEDNPALTISCVVGITTMLAATIWFAAARLQAIRQSQIADALMVQQQAQQRAAHQAAVAARAASRAASSRSGGTDSAAASSRASTDDSRSSDLTMPLLAAEGGATGVEEGGATDVEEGGGGGAEGVAGAPAGVVV